MRINGVIFAIVLLILTGSLGQYWYQHRASPRVILDDSVATDFSALIQETWQQFLTIFAARTNCFGDVRISAVKSLDDRARYDPSTATVVVRVPARGSVLRSALVHEWAHHVEFQCAPQTEIRNAFMAAQGFPVGTAWHLLDGSVNMRSYQWARIPSEQFAETVVAVVLGDAAVRTPVRITDEGISTVRAWAENQSISHSK